MRVLPNQRLKLTDWSAVKSNYSVAVECEKKQS
jgi:hypothetical protein